MHRFELHGQYGLAVFLGTLVLERSGGHTRFCFVSTRGARQNPDASVRFENIPLAYLLDPQECNADATTYRIFSPPGLVRFAQRTGWQVRESSNSGTTASDPATAHGDERMFLLLENDRR